MTTASTGADPVADEARAAYARYVCPALRDRGRAAPVWRSLGEMFTDDAVFVDPAWGRIEGGAAIAEFFEHSMAGLEDWTFPEGWTMAEGAGS